MNKAFFISFTALFFLVSCSSSRDYGFAPKSIDNYILQFRTTQVHDNINQDFLDKDAFYRFSSNGVYELYLENKLHSKGFFAYRHSGYNKSQLVISYKSDDTQYYYVVILHFDSPISGTLRASDESSSINDLLAQFKLVSY